MYFLDWHFLFSSQDCTGTGSHVLLHRNRFPRVTAQEPVPCNMWEPQHLLTCIINLSWVFPSETKVVFGWRSGTIQSHFILHPDWFASEEWSCSSIENIPMRSRTASRKVLSRLHSYSLTKIENQSGSVLTYKHRMELFHSKKTRMESFRP
jgi:hypothetical protein